MCRNYIAEERKGISRVSSCIGSVSEASICLFSSLFALSVTANLFTCRQETVSYKRVENKMISPRNRCMITIMHANAGTRARTLCITIPDPLSLSLSF